MALSTPRFRNTLAIYELSGPVNILPTYHPLRRAPRSPPSFQLRLFLDQVCSISFLAVRQS